MMRLVSDILSDLVVIAEAIVWEPHIAVSRSDQLHRLRVEIAAAILKPVEDERVIDDTAAMLVTCLLRVARDRQSMRGAKKWLAIVEVLLPYVRSDGAAALAAESARPTP